MSRGWCEEGWAETVRGSVSGSASGRDLTRHRISERRAWRTPGSGSPDTRPRWTRPGGPVTGRDRRQFGQFPAWPQAGRLPARPAPGEADPESGWPPGSVGSPAGPTVRTGQPQRRARPNLLSPRPPCLPPLKRPPSQHALRPLQPSHPAPHPKPPPNQRPSHPYPSPPKGRPRPSPARQNPARKRSSAAPPATPRAPVTPPLPLRPLAPPVPPRVPSPHGATRAGPCG